MKKIISFMKKETVLTIATLLAVVSAFFVKPDRQYIGYIDFRTLGILFGLMVIMQGFQRTGLFDRIGKSLLQKTGKLWQLILVLVMLCFFFSMLITNDVSLLTFVPFSILVLKKCGQEQAMIPTVILQTVAANLGSMLTPVGNPQNLLLYSVSGMSMGDFILHMLPLTCVSYVAIVVCIFFIPDQHIILHGNQSQDTKKWLNVRFIVYCILFLICLGNVTHLISSYWTVGLIVAVTIFIVNRRLFTQVDYSLLMTFVGFFIFIGNMKQIPVINQWLQGIIKGNELLVGIVSSQIISNVPAAMLLSGFTTDYKQLLYGVNIGGLGTLIASMASLISYRFFSRTYQEQKGRYFRVFTIYNVVLLVLLYVAACI